MRRKVDFLIIGSGIAGLSYALKVAKYGKVCLVSKDKIDETNKNSIKLSSMGFLIFSN